jgi:Ni,Fe-hydrogenase III large subunit
VARLNAEAIESEARMCEAQARSDEINAHMAELHHNDVLNRINARNEELTKALAKTTNIIDNLNKEVADIKKSQNDKDIFFNANYKTRVKEEGRIFAQGFKEGMKKY